VAIKNEKKMKYLMPWGKNEKVIIVIANRDKERGSDNFKTDAYQNIDEERNLSFDRRPCFGKNYESGDERGTGNRSIS
jgi:hypothetical protein